MKQIALRAAEIARQLKERTEVRPKIGVVLGSGWGGAVDALAERSVISYESLEGMPQCSVVGHAGNFVFGKADGVDVVAVQGRFHLYEGHTTETAVLPVRILSELGVETLILTNAAGGINTKYRPGDLMLLSDHINMTGMNPLVGVRPSSAYPIFVDMTDIYDPTLRNIVEKRCKESGICCHEGVYMQVLGPSYETPTEIRAFRTMGADAVGMSTVIEAISARYLKMRLVGISCISNMASGITGEKLTHTDVLREMDKLQRKICELFKSIYKDIAVLA